MKNIQRGYCVNKIKLIIKGLHEYIWGHLCVILLYKKKYLRSKYFYGNKRLGFLGSGWGWAISDFKARVFLRSNRGIPFPVSYGNHITNYKNIFFDPDDLIIFQGQGKYFQAIDAPIHIGKGTYIADNVGIITTNHDLSDPSKHMSGKPITIGEKCWIGINSVILPGVVLGDNTVVGAGSVVTKSFIEVGIVIAGNPAKFIKKIDNVNI